MNKKKRNINNKGMTLIELLMFIAISSIILAMVLISYNVVNNANATKAARRLETVIRTARTQSMAKGQEEGKLTLTVLDGNVYATIGDPATAESQQICNSGVTVTGILCADANDYKNARVGTPFTSCQLTFNTSGTVREVMGSTDYNKFIINRGNRSFEIIVYSDTGSVETNMF